MQLPPFIVHCERIRKRAAYQLRFQPNDQLLSRVKELPQETRKWNAMEFAWELTTAGLYNLIKRYKGSNKIHFDFGNEETRKIFIQQIKRVEVEEEEKRKFIVDLNIKKEHWAKYKQELEETYEKYSEQCHALLKPGIKLYKHQIVSAMFLNVTRNLLLALDMGTGKSLISILYVEMNTFDKVFVITPNSLKFTYKNEVEKFTNSRAFIIGKKNTCTIEDAKYIIVNYEYFNSSNFKKVKVKFDKLNIGKINCLISDECFTYDTLIDTNKGHIKIGDIVENELDVKILSYNHKLKTIESKSISRYLYNGYKDVIKINLSNGYFIECTPEHKFYSVDEDNYKSIGNFKIGDRLYEYKKEKNSNNKSNLPSMWYRVQAKTKRTEVMLQKMFVKLHSKGECEKITNNERKEWKFITYGNKNMPTMRERISITRKAFKKILFKKLFSDLENESNRDKREDLCQGSWFKNIQVVKGGIFRKSESIKDYIRKNEIEQSDVQAGEYRKNERKARKIHFSFERWKWAINKATTITFFRNIWNNIHGDGISNTNIYAIEGNKIGYCLATNTLQSRYWNSKHQIGNRGGWENAQNKKMEIFRQKKDRNIGIVRVESIEILESRHRPEFGTGGRQSKRVYDLEIVDNHNYFANGILVSNCHHLKSTSSNTFKNFKKIFKDTIFKNGKISKIFMSGTPAPSKAAELYSVLNQISPLDFPTKQQFYEFYCGMTYNLDGYGWETDINMTKFEELFHKIEPYIYRKKKSEVLKDLPEKTYQRIVLEMTPKEYEIYYDLEEGIANEFVNREIKNPLSIMGKLREYTSFLKVNNVKELIDSILESGEKFVAIDFYKNSLYELHKQYPEISALHTGDEKDTERAEIIKDFQDENGKIKIFLGSEGTTKEGLTLTAASKVGMLTIPWTPGALDQCTDRLARIGQKNAVNAYIFIYKDTIDEYIFDLIEGKRLEISQVIDGEKYESDVNQSIINDLIEIIKNKHKKTNNSQE